MNADSFSAKVVAEEALRVLGLVALGAEVLPVAAVGRVVVVIPVLVMDGQQVEVLLVELARAAGADPAVDRERPCAVILRPRPGGALRVADDLLDLAGI